MGMFSYACTKCGGKDQFDWATQCVLKIDDIYVRGRYDGYGRVEIPLEGEDSKDSVAIAYPEQHLDFADSSRYPNALLATEIYCDGDGKQDDDEEVAIQQIAKQQMAMLQALMGGGGNFSTGDDAGGGCNRHCAPKGITILDSLDASMLDTLPKTFGDKQKKHANGTANSANDEAPKKKKAKSAKF